MWGLKGVFSFEYIANIFFKLQVSFVGLYFCSCCYFLGSSLAIVLRKKEWDSCHFLLQYPNNVTDLKQPLSRATPLPDSFCAAAKITPERASVFHPQDYFGAISVTERYCTALILKVERHISDRFFAILWCSVNTYSDLVFGPSLKEISGSEDWNLLRRK